MKHQNTTFITGIAGGIALSLLIILAGGVFRLHGQVSETWWEEQATSDSWEPVEADEDILGIAKDRPTCHGREATIVVTVPGRTTTGTAGDDVIVGTSAMM